METLDSIRQWSQETIEDDSINDLLDTWANEAVRELETMYAWPILLASPTLTGSATGVLTIPSYIRTYNHVFTDPDTYPHEAEYVYRANPTTDGKMRLYEKYYYDIEAGSVGTARSFNCYIAPGGTTLTQQTAESAWFAAADVGKAIHFGDGRGFYRIVSVDTTTIVIDPDFRGVETDDTDYGTAYVDFDEEQVQLRDEDDTAPASVDVQLAAQKYHPFLYLDGDLIQIEAPKSLKLILQRIMLRNGKYDHDARLLDVDLEDTLRREIGPQGHKKQRNLPQNPMFRRNSRARNYRKQRTGGSVIRPF